MKRTMKHNHLLFGTLAALGIAAVATIAPSASASSHREAPAISEDPAADNTDVWAWVSPARDKFYLVASYVPLEEPAGGPNFHKFSDDVLYEFHIARGTSSLDDVITYSFNFYSTRIATVDPADLSKPLGGGKEFFSQLSGVQQYYNVTKTEKGKAPVVIANAVKVAPTNIGPRTNAVAYKPPGGKYDDAYADSFTASMGAEGRVWAGPRDDGFYVDLGGVFDLANLRTAGVAQDGVSGYNCHTIAIEVPTTLLTGTGAAPTGADAELLGVWASASRKKVSVLRADGTKFSYGPYVQVSRQGLPLINEAVIGLQDKDKYNRTRPATDVANFAAYFLNPVVVRDAEAVGIYKALSVPDATVESLKKDRLDIINTINLGKAIPLSATGDVLRVDMNTDPAFPNQRAITGGEDPDQEQADVTDVLLTVLLSKGTIAIADGVNRNDKPFKTTFPFLALPWEGYSQGHGAPAL